MDLEVGRVKTNNEAEEMIKRRTRIQSGKNSGGGRKNRGSGGGGGGNNGGDNDESQNFGDIKEFTPNRFRIGMSFVLLVVMMTFGGLIAAYLVISTNRGLEWKPFNLPLQIWVSTFLILASGISYQISNNKIKSDDQKGAKTWLLTTTFLGAAFISSQIMAWLALARQGFYVESNPYAGFFYILTAVHALHVFGGILALGFILLRSWNETKRDEELNYRKTISNVVGWYWHFMGALWIVLVLLLGFWK